MIFSICATSFTAVVKLSYPLFVIKILSIRDVSTAISEETGKPTFNADSAHFPILIENFRIDIGSLSRVFEVRLNDKAAEVNLLSVSNL